jgi:prevent-host-death family protein
MVIETFWSPIHMTLKNGVWTEPAEAIRQPRDRLKGQPQERQNSAARGGTRVREALAAGLTKSVRCCTVVSETNMVNLILRKGAEEARNQLPDILDAAEKGRSTIITRHGRPVAALVPIEAYGAAIRQQPLMPVAGSGRGLWGKNSIRTLRKLRDEWNR